VNPPAILRLNAALEGRYRIERELGEGGMATVYLAEDLKHERRVALKVLKPELAAVVGAERFLAEIKTTANLQHPHILPLFDSGEADSFLFYVMPYVEGETLRDRLEREKQLPVDEAVRIATDVAEALHSAHEQGVIHRDIKPANILLSEGRPLVADFGIALAVAQAGAGRLTETGLSMGTPYYMSPEQASADREPTPASDVYSVGCVLYEMLVGDPPHTASSAQAVLAKILTEDPPTATNLRSSIPQNVDAAIRRALEKLPADRFTAAQDFVRALSDPGFRHGDGPSRADEDLVASRWRSAAIAGWGLAILGGAFSTWIVAQPATSVRDVGLPYDAPMSLGTFRNFDLARDASFVVYEAAQGPSTVLFYRSLLTDEVRAIQGTQGASGTPRISPDGERVAFMAAGRLNVVAIAGGSPLAIADVQGPWGGGWLESGVIFLSDEDGRVLRWIDPETGPIRELEIQYCISPFLLEGGDAVLCGGGGDNLGNLRDLDDPTTRRYLRRAADLTGGATSVRGSDFRVIDGTYLVYVSPSGDLMGAPVLDPDSLIVGRSVALVSGLRTEAYSGVGQYDIAEDGTLAYVVGPNAEVGRLVRVSEDGAEEYLPIEEAAHVRFDFSPDGRQLASVVEGVQSHELRIYDLRTGRGQTVDQENYVGQPRWSPEIQALYQLEPTSGRDPVKLLEDFERSGKMFPSSYLSDSEVLVGSGSAASAFLMNPSAEPPEVDSLGLSALFIAISPDGRWLGYQAQGAFGVFVEPWPSRDGRYAVDPLGNEATWRSSSELVYYTVSREGFTFHRVRVDGAMNPPVGESTVWMVDPQFADTDGPSFAVSPEGDLVYKRSSAENHGYYFRVVPGWIAEMKRAVNEANP
jgi:serine/threonine-protein kinase